MNSVEHSPRILIVSAKLQTVKHREIQEAREIQSTHGLVLFNNLNLIPLYFICTEHKVIYLNKK